eukprot:c5662_g1_i1.p1 GENE.c5662_g1_i1~~c5662_g1_i1.p1  ORF type:complete len:326 (-),score=103.39 c5662_g1_i1:113-1090(-)
MAVLVFVVLSAVLSENPSQPGQRITIPGPVFPIYASSMPAHHLPDSPQAISLSDVTMLISPDQMSASDVHLDSKVQIGTTETTQNVVAAAEPKAVEAAPAPTTATASTETAVAHDTTTPVAVTPDTTAPVAVAVEPETAAPATVQNVPAAPVTAAPAPAPVAAPAPATVQNVPAAPAPATVQNVPAAPVTNVALQQKPVVSHPAMMAQVPSPFAMQFPQMSQMPQMFNWFMVPQQFQNPFALPQQSFVQTHSGSTRPSAPNYFPQVPSTSNQLPVPPLYNPFKGSTFENQQFPFNPYGTPYVGTPAGLNGYGLFGFGFGFGPFGF